MNYFEVLIISAVLSALAYMAGVRVGFRLGIKVGTIITTIGFASRELTTMTEPDDAPAQHKHIDERV